MCSSRCRLCCVARAAFIPPNISKLTMALQRAPASGHLSALAARGKELAKHAA
jgi:hypothetical protein